MQTAFNKEAVPCVSCTQKEVSQILPAANRQQAVPPLCFHLHVGMYGLPVKVELLTLWPGLPLTYL